MSRKVELYWLSIKKFEQAYLFAVDSTHMHANLLPDSDSTLSSPEQHYWTEDCSTWHKTYEIDHLNIWSCGEKSTPCGVPCKAKHSVKFFLCVGIFNI